MQTATVSAGISPIVEKIVMGDQSVEIIAKEGNPPYFYSLNGIDWQVSNFFGSLKPGNYNVFVKSQANSCTTVVPAFVLNIPNAITPDGDGNNDVFEIGFIENFPQAELSIFDRFVKLIYKSDHLSENQWKGNVGKRAVSTGTYWYHLNLKNGFEKSGWILVKNRK